MVNKLYFFCLALLSALTLNSQNNQVMRTCATPIPDQKWDEWFNAEVEKVREYYKANRVAMPNYVIPVVVHVIHSGGAVGAGDNISQAQVQDQINIINDDFKGIGFNVGQVPSAFASSLADCQVSFCLAVTDPSNNAMPEPGIHRVAATSIPGITSVPANGFTQAQINNTIKPATIWDPTKYCNMWVLKLTNGLLGYATFPAGTTLPGVAGGGTATNDGVVMGHNYFGSIGSAAGSAPYHKGRTTTHELGHWLGLRHVWGDGNCLTDFCNDTPVAKQANFGCPAQPAYVNRCGAGQSPNGEMTMNFMDYTDDPCMYMFTNDQKTRIQTAMSQGTFRNQLGTHGLCTPAGPPPPPNPPVAAFDIKTSPCVGQAFTPQNNSTGGPVPSFMWSSTPSASFNPGPNVASPAITFTAPGTYTIYVTATNTAGTSNASMVVNNVGECPKPAVCLDTLRKIKPADTLTTYYAPTSNLVLNCQSGFTGFLSGTNCYQDKEFAQYYPPSTYSDTPMPQVNSVIVLFNKVGTKATSTTQATQIICKIYSGSVGNGPTNQITMIGDSLGKIAALTATDQVTFVGNPNYVFPNNDVLVHKFNFVQPALVPATGFFAAVQTPFASSTDSIWIYSSTKTNTTNDSSAWVFQFNNNWRTMRYNRQAKVQLAILPQITCRPVVGLQEQSPFVSNITVMPNPSNGLFSILFTLPKEQKVSIKVFNSIGQLISKDEYLNVSNKLFDMDLSSRPEGIYFVEISNGNEIVTKKVMISR